MLLHFPNLSERIYLCLFVGLMNSVNHPNIKTPVDLANVLNDLKRRNNTLMEQNSKTEKINFDLSVECQSINERCQKSNQIHQKFLEDKEKQLEGLLEKKREATLKNQRLIGDVSTLNERLKFLEKKIEILQQENKIFRANIDNELYLKQTKISDTRIKDLESKIEDLVAENKKLFNENLERQEKINISEKVIENQKSGFHCKIRNLEQQICNQVDDIAKKNEDLSYLMFINGKKSTEIQSLQKEVEDLLVKFQESNYPHENLEYEENIAHEILKNKFEVSASYLFLFIKTLSYFLLSFIQKLIYIHYFVCIYIYIYIYICIYIIYYMYNIVYI